MKPADDFDLSADMTGRHIGPYLLQQQLGRGGMGTVYLGIRQDDELSMKVAVKLLHREWSTPRVLARFRRERQTLADLRHPNIAQLMDAGTTDDGHPWLIMEWVQGTHIDVWCAENNASTERILLLIRKAAQALGHAHRTGVIHCDIKPQNLMINRDGEPKLLDFGIAQMAVDDGETPTAKGRESLMTPAYAAPEQKEGTISAAADVYALGLVLLQLLIGRPPARLGCDPLEAVTRLTLHGRQPIQRDFSDNDATLTSKYDPTMDPQPSDAEGEPTEPGDPLPESLGYVMRRALAPTINDRFPSMDAFVSSLDQVLTAMRGDEPDQRRGGTRYDAVFWCHPDFADRVRHLVALLQREPGLTAVYPSDQNPGSRALHHTLEQAKVCVVCLGDPTDAAEKTPWQWAPALRDKLAFHARLYHFLPLLLPHAAFPEKQSLLPSFLRGKTWLRLEDIAVEGLQPLVAAIRGIQGEGQVRELPPGTCPFRGLEVFREQDRHLFFGREAVSQRIAEYILRRPFGAVLGPSGSGKSSLVQAGVNPRLRAFGFEICLFRPGHLPTAHLVGALREVLPDFFGRSHQVLEHQLRTVPGRLSALAAEFRLRHGRRLLVVVDQFEEIFTQCKNLAERKVFVDALCNAVEHSNDHLHLLVTMRSDFLGKCAVFHDLNDLITDHFLQLGPMNREELARAVEAPARLAGLNLQAGLLEQVLNEVSGAPGALPLLEHALLELYQKREGPLLTRRAYDEIGGIKGALAKRAEYEYGRLNPTQQHVLRKMFILALIQPGEGTEDTRRQATGPELIAIGGAEVPPLLRTWTEVHLLTASRDTARDAEVYEVAHEALIGSWSRIKEWMEEGRETARLLNRLRQFATTWDEAGRDEDHLLRGGPLFQMQELVRTEEAHLGEREKAFVAAGLALAAQQSRNVEATATALRRRKNHAQVASLAALLLAAFAFAMLFQANHERDRANHERQRAETALREAEAQTLAGNFSLATMLTEEAGLALQKHQSGRAWLYTLAALSHEIPADRDLPTALGRFADPKMGDVDRLIWSSPANPGAVRSAFHPDGQSVAVASSDHRIRLLDLNNGGPRGMLQGHNNLINALAFHPNTDQPLLVSAGDDYAVRLWRLPSEPWVMAAAVATLTHEHPVVDLAFSPDGSLLAALTDQGGIFLYQVDPRQPEQTRAAAEYHPSEAVPFRVVRFNAEGDQLIAGDSQGRLHFLHLDDQTRSKRTGFTYAAIIGLEATAQGWITLHEDGDFYLWRDGPQDPVRPASTAPDNALALAVLPNRTQLMTYHASGTLRLWDLKSGKNTWRQATDLFQTLTENDELPAPKQPQLAMDRHHGRAALSNGEWSLWQAHQNGPRRALGGHRAAVWDVAYSPDGRLIASSSRDRRVILWDRETGLQKRVLLNQKDDIFTIAFSPDGRFLASGSSDSTIALFDLEQPEAPPRILKGHTLAVRDLAFSPDGAFLAGSSYDHSIRIWNLAKGTAAILQGHDSVVWSIAFSPDGQTLVSTSADSQVILWDWAAGKQRRVLRGHDADVWTAAFSPDGSMLATGSADHRVLVWNLADFTIRHELRGHTASSLAVRFSPDNRLLASGSYDATVAIWRVDDGALVTKLSDHNDGVWNLAFSPDGRELATASYDNTFKRWAVHESDQADTIKAHAAAILGLAFSPDGRTVASASMDQSIKLWDFPSGKPIQTLLGHSAAVWCISFSPDGRLIASSSYDQSITVWDKESRRLLHRLEDHQGEIRNVVFSPDTNRLASCAYDGSVKIWDTDTGKHVITFDGHINEVWGLAFSPDGKRLASASIDQTVRLWDMETLKPTNALRAHASEVWDVAFSPDGTLLATASRDKTISLWDSETLTPRGTLSGHEAPIWSVDFSPDGRFLASASVDDTVRVWNLATQRPFAGFHAAGGNANNVVFSPNGDTLVSAHDDGTLRFWRLNQLEPFSAMAGSHDGWRTLRERSLFHFGYRFDGVSLDYEPRVSLVNPDGTPLGQDHPFTQLYRPKPGETPLIEWLQRQPATPLNTEAANFPN
ncbi:WD40 repeat domain-containing serine/threonine protein kinase [Acanthopleuribacter pedis]|uniref:Protein kinase n=1 Tax=Acanthopleuribacter pedis TaxID=442870 RepID=A0A8J7Q879_9BACT|nr:protein kinase [Acanthopleuribacter pedis]MBO1319497.1 protein kinase [Acanthopleuribacter pedis]